MIDALARYEPYVLLGIFGLGLLLTIGTACGLVTSLVVLPVILRLITKRAAAPAAESLRQTSAA
jgi:predicted RND superfamily exporter protein